MYKQFEKQHLKKLLLLVNCKIRKTNPVLALTKKPFSNFVKKSSGLGIEERAGGAVEQNVVEQSVSHIALSDHFEDRFSVSRAILLILTH